MNKIFNDDAISIMDRMIAKEYKKDLFLKNELKKRGKRKKEI